MTKLFEASFVSTTVAEPPKIPLRVYVPAGMTGCGGIVSPTE
jgi:hypothetical protein